MSHLRYILAVILLASVTARCGAQTMIAPPLQTEEEKQPPKEEKEKPEPWQLHPAPEPEPALRYRFWPAPQERVPSNPIPFVNRAIILLQQNLSPREERDEFWQNYNEWSDMPLEELPIAEIKKALAEHASNPLKELQRAENLMDLEYDLRMHELSVSDTVATLLPEFQEMRSLARLLQLRGRVAIAEGRWDDFARDVRVGFRLAEVAGHSTDLLVGRLIGIAISGVMMNLVEEAIQQPGCPNFYWALAAVPDRLFEIRESIRFESTLIGRVFPGLPELSDEPIGEVAARGQLQQMATEASALQSWGPVPSDTAAAKLVLGSIVVTLAEPARDYLATTTRWGDAAYHLSASEAVLRAGRLKVARVQDGWVKWTLLPAELFSEYENEMEQAMRPGTFPPDPITALAQGLLPAIGAASQAERRGLQTRNLLITVEAIRMHAAGQGSLPGSLDSLEPVPAWPDAIGYSPFGYERTSANRATLTREPRYPGDKETTLEIHLDMEAKARPRPAVTLPDESRPEVYSGLEKSER